MTDILEQELRRIEFDFEEEQIEIRALIDRPLLEIENIRVALKKDEVTKVQFWVAEILVENDMAEFIGDQELDFSKLVQIAYDEKNSKRLVELNTPLFIRRVKNEIKRLEEKGDFASLRKLTSVRGSYNSIMRSRFKKLVNHAQGTDKEGKRRLFAAEEEWMYYKLRELFDSWMRLIES